MFAFIIIFPLLLVHILLYRLTKHDNTIRDANAIGSVIAALVAGIFGFALWVALQFSDSLVFSPWSLMGPLLLGFCGSYVQPLVFPVQKWQGHSKYFPAHRFLSRQTIFMPALIFAVQMSAERVSPLFSCLCSTSVVISLMLSSSFAHLYVPVSRSYWTENSTFIHLIPELVSVAAVLSPVLSVERIVDTEIIVLMLELFHSSDNPLSDLQVILAQFVALSTTSIISITSVSSVAFFLVFCTTVLSFLLLCIQSRLLSEDATKLFLVLMPCPLVATVTGLLPAVCFVIVFFCLVIHNNFTETNLWAVLLVSVLTWRVLDEMSVINGLVLVAAILVITIINVAPLSINGQGKYCWYI